MHATFNRTIDWLEAHDKLAGWAPWLRSLCSSGSDANNSTLKNFKH